MTESISPFDVGAERAAPCSDAHGALRSKRFIVLRNEPVEYSGELTGCAAALVEMRRGVAFGP